SGNPPRLQPARTYEFPVFVAKTGNSVFGSTHGLPERKEHAQRNGQERNRGGGQRRNAGQPQTTANRENGKTREEQSPNSGKTQDNGKPELPQAGVAAACRQSGGQRKTAPKRNK